LISFFCAQKQHKCISQDKNNVTFGIKRLVILIPDEMFVNGVLESHLLDKAEVTGNC